MRQDVRVNAMLGHYLLEKYTRERIIQVCSSIALPIAELTESRGEGYTRCIGLGAVNILTHDIIVDCVVEVNEKTGDYIYSSHYVSFRDFEVRAHLLDE